MFHQLILALDGLNLQQALGMIRQFGDQVYAVKVHDLLDGKYQQETIKMLKNAGANKLWIDYKLHDIPKTAARRAKALKKAGADIVSVHASGGKKMMQAVMEAELETYAVTVLTSLDEPDVFEIYNRETEEQVRILAGLAVQAGVTGVVCSALELKALQSLPSEFKRVVPGTRSAGVAKGDQARTATPAEALAAGAHHLVIASQITEDTKPQMAWDSLIEEISTAKA